MANLKINDINKNFGSTEVLKGINLDINDGDFLVLLGPSGCGKSTLLNTIAGLETSNSGEILIDNHVVNNMEPSDRDIALVFQSYALYPAMTVRKNVTFGLEQRKTPKEKISEALNEVSNLLQINELLDRKPSQLSGGQRQRVAMGRALVRHPKVFLFDEPLSNLDAKLRVEMRREIKKLHKRLKTTIVYVTHDQTEAMSLGTNIAIMDQGKIQQCDTPKNIYNKPQNMFVADFIGSPSMNLLEGSLNNKIFKPNGSDNVQIPLEKYDFINIVYAFWPGRAQRVQQKPRPRWLWVEGGLAPELCPYLTCNTFSFWMVLLCELVGLKTAQNLQTHRRLELLGMAWNISLLVLLIASLAKMSWIGVSL